MEPGRPPWTQALHFLTAHYTPKKFLPQVLRQIYFCAILCLIPFFRMRREWDKCLRLAGSGNAVRGSHQKFLEKELEEP